MIVEFFQAHSLLALILLIGEVLWLAALVIHLKEEKMKDTDKICWTIVLCTLNLLGLALYVFLADSARETLTEEGLKRAANEGRL